MPNGGSDCCGTCKKNKANQEIHTMENYCQLRNVRINNPYWTYCADWSGFKPDAFRPVPYGPIYSSGIYEGYVRIPWNGVHEPMTYVSGQCYITGEVFEKSGIKVFDDKLGKDVYFVGNYQYYQWYQSRYPHMPLPYKYTLDNYVENVETDLHGMYTVLYKQGRFPVDFIHTGRDSILPENKNTNSLLKRIQGALVGGAVGDALGSGVEGRLPGAEPIDTYIPWEDWHKGPIGTISDDTQMTMWLTESLLDNDGLCPGDIADRFISQHIRGIGMATRDFIRNHKDKKMPWAESGTKSAGNGAAMRAAPIGIYYRNHPDDIKLAAGIQAMITHDDPMAIASSIVMAYATAYLLAVDKQGLSDIEKRIKFCHEIAEVIAGIEDSQDYRCNQTGEKGTLYQRIRYDIPVFLKKGESPAYVQEYFWSGAYVLESLPFALYCFLYSPDDFKQTLLTAVNESLDSDTVGAMACTLSGAYNGIDAIPAYYRDKNNLEFYSELLDLSQQLFKQKGV